MKGMITPLEMGGDSKMSSEELPLEVSSTQDKIQNMRALTISLKQSLFTFKIQCEYTRGKTPYL